MRSKRAAHIKALRAIWKVETNDKEFRVRYREQLKERESFQKRPRRVVIEESPVAEEKEDKEEEKEIPTLVPPVPQPILDYAPPVIVEWMEDPYLAYATLKVPPTATKDEIRASFLRLALKHHPDHNGGNSLIFLDVLNAYRTIG